MRHGLAVDSVLLLLHRGHISSSLLLFRRKHRFFMPPPYVHTVNFSGGVRAFWAKIRGEATWLIFRIFRPFFTFVYCIFPNYYYKHFMAPARHELLLDFQHSHTLHPQGFSRSNFCSGPGK